MPLAPLKPDPVLSAEVEWPFETPAPDSGEEAMVRALWLHRMQEANRLWAQVWKDQIAEDKARRIAQAQQPPKPQYPDTMQGTCQRDYDRMYELNQDEWEYGS